MVAGQQPPRSLREANDVALHFVAFVRDSYFSFQASFVCNFRNSWASVDLSDVCSGSL